MMVGDPLSLFTLILLLIVVIALLLAFKSFRMPESFRENREKFDKLGMGDKREKEREGEPDN